MNGMNEASAAASQSCEMAGASSRVCGEKYVKYSFSLWMIQSVDVESAGMAGPLYILDIQISRI